MDAGRRRGAGRGAAGGDAASPRSALGPVRPPRAAGVPENARDLRESHTWSWLYRADDTYVVYYDGYVVQRGSIRWTLGGNAGAEALELYFIIDVGWGHLEIPDIDISLPAADFPITYEIDYSRVYLR